MPTYGRAQLGIPRLSAVVKRLLIALLCAYVLQLLLERWAQIPVVSTLAMWPASPALWQLVTYVLVDQNDPIFFMLGLLFLWWALAPFEIGYGPRRTLQLCFVSVLAGSIPAYLMGFVLPASPPLAGSMPLWFGGIAAATWAHRDQPMSLFGMLTMTARQLLLLLLGMSVLMFLFSKDHTQLVANMGAMAGGIGFVRWIKRPRGRPRSRQAAPKMRSFKVIQGGSGENDRPKWLN